MYIFNTSDVIGLIHIDTLFNRQKCHITFANYVHVLADALYKLYVISSATYHILLIYTYYTFCTLYVYTNSIDGLPLYSGDVMTTSIDCSDGIPAVETLNVGCRGVVAMETQRPA